MLILWVQFIHKAKRLFILYREELKNLFLNSTPLIDVRAPVEFSQGHLPGAVNLPILNDQEREIIGTIYKKQGSVQAVKAGYEMVSGNIKEQRLHFWSEYIHLNPDSVLYCFRGGQRSQITQKWLADAGINTPIISGGFKRARNFLIDELQRLSKELKFILISGPTGSGKTSLLKLLNQKKSELSAVATVDLEKLANHKGSAFGGPTHLQPSQVLFENNLTVELLKIENNYFTHNVKLKRDCLDSKLVFFEDESRMIGRCAIPRCLFEALRASQVIWIDEKIEVRIENIFKDYILDTAIGKFEPEAEILFRRYIESIESISRKLGGLRAQELITDIKNSIDDFKKEELISNKVWIEKLLIWYYDPMYLGSLDRRQVSVLHKGSFNSCVEYIMKLSS
jgi:tRNA 2-selenouridine synthase